MKSVRQAAHFIQYKNEREPYDQVEAQKERVVRRNEESPGPKWKN